MRYVQWPKNGSKCMHVSILHLFWAESNEIQRMELCTSFRGLVSVRVRAHAPNAKRAYYWLLSRMFSFSGEKSFTLLHSLNASTEYLSAFLIIWRALTQIDISTQTAKATTTTINTKLINITNSGID